jgi:hypothetical protein
MFSGIAFQSRGGEERTHRKVTQEFAAAAGWCGNRAEDREADLSSNDVGSYPGIVSTVPKFADQIAPFRRCHLSP